MQIEIFFAIAFLLQCSTALSVIEVRNKTFEDLDGHKYNFEIKDNGEQIIFRDGQRSEIAIPLKEHGFWVVIKEDNKDVCYVVDMTKEEPNDRPSNGQFKLIPYKVKTNQEFHPDIKRTCEEYGGEGRIIIQLEPKDGTNPSTTFSLFQGHRGGEIVKRREDPIIIIIIIIII
ncbi:uncharacterized protein LOC121370559 [Gigantopelta aegis]|uniref:uncharacterized protein LOC121370559 n=1 Tax=Gigantopelta aegis TaxID=1735272 RepID=UPI001B889920|nr:uncharacterized protein LOC121370559 [Gigantopelta aegis]